MGCASLIVLDTHAWLWSRDDPFRLSPAARRAIEEADRVGVCAISCWEVAGLVARGRIRLDRDVGTWVRQGLAGDRVVPLPMQPEVALEAALLDRKRFPSDPADQLIYATALAENARLVTKDRALRSFDPARTLW